MLSLLIRRVLTTLPLLLILSFVIFGMMHVAPGDPAVVAAGGGDGVVTPEAIERAREQLGLDDPFLVQYGRWIGGALQGDLGTSFFTSFGVVEQLWRRLPVTLSLTFGGVIVSILVALPAGLIAALRPGGWVDRAVLLLTSLGIAAPSFFVALLLVLVFSHAAAWLPATGYVPLSEDPVAWASHLTLAWLALGFAVAAELTRHLRSAMRDTLMKEYVRTARAGGIPTWKIGMKHALKNAAIPVVTVLGFRISWLLGGSVVIEQVFGLRGLGHLAVTSVTSYDFPVIQGILVVVVLIVLLTNLLVDLAYGYLNPKVRISA